MAIEVKREPADVLAADLMECCAICGAETRYWAGDGAVACCQECAATHEPSDLPSRDEWFDRETRRLEDKRAQARRGW